METIYITKGMDILEVIMMLPKGTLSISTGGVAPPFNQTFTENEVIGAINKIQKESSEKEFSSQAAIVAFVKNDFGKENNCYSLLV